MNQLQSYQELSLNPGASEWEIKAAFRRLAKDSHPDSATDGGNPQKFQKAFEAYQNLLAKARERRETVERALNGARFQFLSQRQEGLDIYYDLALVWGDGPVTLTLPKATQEVCPRCFGQGRTLTQLSQGSVYRPTICPRCGGEGHIDRVSHITAHLTEEMARAGKIRLKGAGAQATKSDQRGDLYLTVHLVDKLDKNH
ncbi:MAG: DnaJ domain-containing protein [Deltaproteobacteria bacterium]|jgi:DnaJ-class molecular chaperone|nr:DnaJ domain-containing protein [Deltaproteobacteria bacterium]